MTRVVFEVGKLIQTQLISSERLVRYFYRFLYLFTRSWKKRRGRWKQLYSNIFATRASSGDHVLSQILLLLQTCAPCSEISTPLLDRTSMCLVPTTTVMTSYRITQTTAVHLPSQATASQR